MWRHPSRYLAPPMNVLSFYATLPSTSTAWIDMILVPFQPNTLVRWGLEGLMPRSRPDRPGSRNGNHQDSPMGTSHCALASLSSRPREILVKGSERSLQTPIEVHTIALLFGKRNATSACMNLALEVTKLKQFEDSTAWMVSRKVVRCRHPWKRRAWKTTSHEL